MDKQPPKEVNSLSELPQYTNRSIDITPQLNFSRFVLNDSYETTFDIYYRMAISVGDIFDSKGLVEVESYIYSVKRHGKVIHHQVNVLGRDPTNGQPYSAYLM